MFISITAEISTESFMLRTNVVDTMTFYRPRRIFNEQKKNTPATFFPQFNSSAQYNLNT